MSQELHSLLSRQLRRYRGCALVAPEAWPGYSQAVSAAYCAFVDDRRLLERALDLSSQ